MDFICSWYVANCILRKSFDDKIYITLSKLNCLLYLLYSNYIYKTGNKLFNELFIKTNNGPCVCSVHYKFKCFENRVIKRFASDATRKIFVVNGDSFNECLSYVWNTYKYMSDDEILNYVNNNNAVYRKKIDEYLDDIDILDDEIKRNSLILENAKVCRKKLIRY